MMKASSYFLIAVLSVLSCTAQEKIAYNVLQDPASQDYEVYIMDADGGNAQNITNSKSVDWVYFAVENKIYFLSDRNACFRCLYLYEMDADGKNVRKVFNEQVADSWMSSRNEGKQFVVKPAEAGDASFYIIDLKGAIVDKVRIDMPYVNDPAFSPDGRKIVFRASEKQSPRELGFTDALYVMELGKNQLQKITTHPDEHAGKRWTGYLAAAPRWRKDGKISFASKLDGNYDIYTIAPDGTNKTAVSPAENNQVYHDWNAQGEMVFEASTNNHDGYELYKRRVDGTIVQLTKDNIEQYAPVFVKEKSR